ncbi:restriction endonuclease [Halobacterium salinarum]|uniref:restriction endonuclease n=1 Tax=Halobacterium salinarum TaxID=2242 RepID=UPI0025533606|nr:restriction endonuclease [Halobacterium salinarum]MDL0140299.1 restriction endonuclease [Halobacterium salinarum]
MAFTQEKLLEQLQKVDAYEFEQFVAKLWEVQNWDTYVTKGADDGGVDVIVEKSTPFPRKQVIQVKRYEPSNSVGRPEIQQYASLRQEQTDVDMVVVLTTGRFTDGAEEVARKLNVKLIDGPQLYNLIEALDAFQLAQSYVDSEVNEAGTSSTESEDISTDTPVQEGDPVEGSQSITGFEQKSKLNDVPTHLPALIKLRETITKDVRDLQSEADRAENAFRGERYFDAVEQYEEVNRRRIRLQREIARYDAGLTHIDSNSVEHLPSARTFATDLAQITEKVNEHFQEAYRIAERAKGLELLVAEICDRVESIMDCIERGDRMQQNAEVERAHSKYEQAESDLEEVHETMEIYQGLVSTYDDAVIDCHSGLPQEISLSDLETEIASRFDSKEELVERQNIAKNAAGSFSESLLTDNSGELFDKDLIEYIKEDEKLEFVFVPPRMGFKVASSEGAEGTPQHDPLQTGSSFLVVTDQRILYVAGVDDHDETWSIPYNELSSVTVSTEATSGSIQFIGSDGTAYRFEGLRSEISGLKRASDYINNLVE